MTSEIRTAREEVAAEVAARLRAYANNIAHRPMDGNRPEPHAGNPGAAVGDEGMEDIERTLRGVLECWVLHPPPCTLHPLLISPIIPLNVAQRKP